MPVAQIAAPSYMLPWKQAVRASAQSSASMHTPLLTQNTQEDPPTTCSSPPNTVLMGNWAGQDPWRSGLRGWLHVPAMPREVRDWWLGRATFSELVPARDSASSMPHSANGFSGCLCHVPEKGRSLSQGLNTKSMAVWLYGFNTKSREEPRDPGKDPLRITTPRPPTHASTPPACGPRRRKTRHTSGPWARPPSRAGTRSRGG